MRRQLIFVAMASILAACFAAPASAQSVSWNFNVFGPPREVTVELETVRDFYKKESNGAVDLKISYGAALGPERQALEAIKAGGYEGAQLCAGYYPNKFPLLTVMELPFITPANTAKTALVYDAVINHPLIVKEMGERWGIRYLAPVFLPPFEFMGNKRIASVADMRGIRMRITGLTAKALQKHGAVPTMVTAPEAYTAVERGTVDSLGFPYAYTFGAYKIYEISKYVTEGIAINGFMCFQGMSIKAWQKLPKNLQDKLKEGQKLASHNLLEAYRKADEKWIPIFKQKLEMTQFPPAERAKLAAGANDIWEDWVKESRRLPAGPAGKSSDS